MTALVALSLVAALGATPEYSVVVTRRLGVAAPQADALANRLAGALDARGAKKLGTLVPAAAFRDRLKKAGAADPTSCAGASACAAKLGDSAHLSRIVSVQFAGLGASTTVDAAVLEVPSGTSLAVLTVTVKSPAELDAFATALLAAVPEPTPEVPAGPTVAASGREPPPPLPPPPPLESGLTPIPAVEQTPGFPVRRKIALGLGAGALIAIGAGIAFGVTAQTQASQLSSRSPTFLEDQRRVRSFALGADVSYGIGAALAASALVIWFTTPPPPQGVAWRLVPTGPGLVLDVRW